MSDVADEMPKGPSEGPKKGEETTIPWVNVLQDEETATKIATFLEKEIVEVRDGSERSELKDLWRDYRKMRKSTPEKATRDYPWKNACNVVPPLTQQKIQTVVAKLNSAFSVKKPPVEVTAFDEQGYATAQALEHFLAWFADNPAGMALSRKRRLIHYDEVSLGTAFVYVAFVNETRRFIRLGTDGSKEETVASYIGPSLLNVRLEDFLTRPHWTDLQRAPWFAIEFRYFYHELMQQQQLGNFADVDKIKTRMLEKYDDAQLEELEKKGITVSSLASEIETAQYRVYLAHLYWDVDQDGTPEDLIIWFHPETRTILRADYNPIGKRPITAFGYEEEPDLLYAMGLCEILKSTQEEVTALHRMRIDGTQLAMLKVWVGARSSGLNEDEVLNPFKFLTVDNPQSDVKVVDFPDVAPSCVQGEMIARDYADKVSGASDIMSGFYDTVAKSGQNASSTLALLQMGNSILNSILETAEVDWSDVWNNVLYQLIANKDQLDYSMLPQKEIDLLTTFFKETTLELLPTKFKFKVRTTDINQTGDAKRQMMLAANQLYLVYAEKAMALFGMIQQVKMALMQASQSAPEQASLLVPQYLMMLKFYVGYTSMVKEVFDTFGVEAPTRFLPDLAQEEATIEAEQLRRGSEGAAGARKGGGEPGAAPMGGGMGPGAEPRGAGQVSEGPVGGPAGGPSAAAGV